MACGEWTVGYNLADVLQAHFGVMACGEWTVGYNKMQEMLGRTLLWLAGNGRLAIMFPQRQTTGSVMACGEWTVGYNLDYADEIATQVMACGEWTVGYNDAPMMSLPNVVMACGEWTVGYNPLCPGLRPLPLWLAGNGRLAIIVLL